METNIILETDSYKLSHYKQYPRNTENVYSYLESRDGAQFKETVFFGLQYILQNYLEGPVVTDKQIKAAKRLATTHFGNADLFNEKGWRHILEKHNGRLPLRIKAVPEGTPIPVSNVLMTVENTCPECYWLTNAVESLLTHVWYPSTVATLSREIKKMLDLHLMTSSDNPEAIDFMLQDFGYRGATSSEAAAIGGAGHLVNFKGTDTLPAMLLAMEHYDADLNNLGFSVPATEHSVMTAKGIGGEWEVVDQLLEDHPSGILSVVADSYDIYRFVDTICTRYKEQIMERDGTFVVRPDSITQAHKTPAEITLWIVNRLWRDFPGEKNSKGYRVLDPHVRVLYGDGIDKKDMNAICMALINKGFSVENMVFGMGGGLLQKVNRDTQRFAFKSSAQKRGGAWYDVYKNPLDRSKASKRGRLKLFKRLNGEYETVREEVLPDDHVAEELLRKVFQDGVITKHYTFDEVRKNAKM